MENHGGYKIWQYIGRVDFRGLKGLFWKHIRNGWGKFTAFIRVEVSNGYCIQFWLDLWCWDVILKKAFPARFRITQNKEASVTDHMNWTNGVLHWDVLFIWVVHD